MIYKSIKNYRESNLGGSSGSTFLESGSWRETAPITTLDDKTTDCDSLGASGGG